MKRGLLYFLAVVAFVIGVYVLFFRNNDNPSTPQTAQPTAPSAAQKASNDAYARLLSQYQALHSALVDWDTVKVNQAAAGLENAGKNFSFQEMGLDSVTTKTARDYVDSIWHQAAQIHNQSNLENKRRTFAVLSSNMYELGRIMRYNATGLYKVTCNMPFDGDESADWVSTQNEVMNPYLGKYHPKYKDGMLNCGEVIDSIAR